MKEVKKNAKISNFIQQTQIFLDALAGVVEPERKRKTIGHKFIEVFDEAAEAMRALLERKVTGRVAIAMA